VLIPLPHLAAGTLWRQAYAAREIADWLARNPGEIVFLGLERYLVGHDAEVSDSEADCTARSAKRARAGSATARTDDIDDLLHEVPNQLRRIGAGPEMTARTATTVVA
jgi:hypothetical protein